MGKEDEMFKPKSSASRFWRVEYVVADPEEGQAMTNRYDFAENPCQQGSDEECAEWLSERLTACYNDD